MIIYTNYKKIKNEVNLILLILLFQHIIFNLFLNKELFPYTWIIFTLSWIISIIIYYIIIIKLLNKIKIKLINILLLLNIDDNKINIILLILKDIIKFSIIYIIRDIIYYIILNESISINTLFNISNIYTILGYTIYNIIYLLYPDLYSHYEWKYLYNDSVKTTCGEISRNILYELRFNFEHFISIIGILIGIFIYHIIF